MAQVQQLTPAQQQALQNQQALQANMQARAYLLSQAFDVKQQVDSQTFVPSARNVYDVSGTNVGIVKGFVLKVVARIKNNSATEAASLTNFGVANLLKQVTYYDPNNQRHIETTGWHIAMVNTIKGQKPFGSSTPTDSPIKYGDNYDIIEAPETIAAGESATVVMHYWIPLAYSDTDLSGAVFANVAQSKQRLRLEFATDATAFVATNENTLEAVYSSDDADLTFEEISYTCYQHYLDQLPMNNGQYIVPSIDLSTVYLLENTVQAGLTPNADFAVQYGNLYRYLSTIAIYDNGGVFTPKGADVNYLAQRTANFSDYRKAQPDTWNLETRKLIGTDLPPSVYLAENRNRPIYTLQTGNQTFVINPKTVNQNARLILAYESFVTATHLVNIGTISTT